MKNVRATVAEYEREKIKERTTRARRQIVKAGAMMLHGNQPPYGYRLSDDGKKLVVYEPEARIVRLIFTWYAEGDENGKRLGSRAIARRLTEMGVPTWNDLRCKFKKRVFGQWADTSARNILSNETYLGCWYYGKRKTSGEPRPRSYWLPVEVPAIITRELWEKAQAQKKQNKEMARRNVRHDYLVGRRVTCGQCGHKMHGKPAWANKYVYLYYYCAAKAGDIVGQSCNSPVFRADQVDAAVWNWVKSFLSDPVALQEGLAAYQAECDHKNQPLRERLKVIDNLLEENQAQMSRLLDLYLAGDFSKEMLVERKNRLETTISGLKKERASLIVRLESQTLTDDQMQSLKDFAARVAEGVEHADEDFGIRRQIIDALDVRATLAVEDGEKVVYVRCMVGDGVLSVVNGST